MQLYVRRPRLRPFFVLPFQFDLCVGNVVRLRFSTHDQGSVVSRAYLNKTNKCLGGRRSSLPGKTFARRYSYYIQYCLARDYVPCTDSKNR